MDLHSIGHRSYSQATKDACISFKVSVAALAFCSTLCTLCTTSFSGGNKNILIYFDKNVKLCSK